jgi:hypothetical protein
LHFIRHYRRLVAALSCGGSAVKSKPTENPTSVHSSLKQKRNVELFQGVTHDDEGPHKDSLPAKCKPEKVDELGQKKKKKSAFSAKNTAIELE